MFEEVVTLGAEAESGRHCESIGWCAGLLCKLRLVTFSVQTDLGVDRSSSVGVCL